MQNTLTIAMKPVEMDVTLDFEVVTTETFFQEMDAIFPIAMLKEDSLVLGDPGGLLTLAQRYAGMDSTSSSLIVMMETSLLETDAAQFVWLRQDGDVLTEIHTMLINVGNTHHMQ